jgi:hypothetical protein
LLGRVVDRLARTGGDAVVLFPFWSPALQRARAFSRSEFSLPSGPLFRREGWDTLPAPRWGACILWIQRVPTAPFSLLGRAFPRRAFVANANGNSGRGLSLLSCGDVEANPGPRRAPSSGGSGWRILCQLEAAGLQGMFDLFMAAPPAPGPSSSTMPPAVPVSRSGWWELKCRCGALILARDSVPLLAHAKSCPDILRLQAGTPPPTGRGETLLSCGDVEANPGPSAGPSGPAVQDWAVTRYECSTFDYGMGFWVHEGPSGDRDSGPVTSRVPFFPATCLICGVTLWVREAWQLYFHLEICLLDARTVTGTVPRTGRGDSLVSCGDVEANPGPAGDNPSLVDDVDLAHAIPPRCAGSRDAAVIADAAGNAYSLRNRPEGPLPSRPVPPAGASIFDLMGLRVSTFATSPHLSRGRCVGCGAPAFKHTPKRGATPFCGA